jgi:hypothetical protein
MLSPFSIAADHDKNEYYVRNHVTGDIIITYPYKGELDRARAAGLATLKRKHLAEDWYRARKQK